MRECECACVRACVRACESVYEKIHQIIVSHINDLKLSRSVMFCLMNFIQKLSNALSNLKEIIFRDKI